MAPLFGTCRLFALFVTLSVFALPSFAQDQVTEEIEELGEALDSYVFPPSGPFTPDAIGVPNASQIAAWAGSAHADAAAEAFAHWNDDGEIPGTCAVCHSGAGFRAFHGLDGGEAGPLQSSIPTGGVVDCETCHNPGLAEIKSITLPSGVEHPAEVAEVPCLTCHTGRSSGERVSAEIEGGEVDAVDSELRFINPHYKIAGATWLGGYGGIGYHYQGKTYSGRFLHAKPVSTCLSCHEPHALTIAENVCLTCHAIGDPKAIRISRQSYDGSGDTTKGIAADIKSNSDLLMAKLSAYAESVAGTGLIYDGNSYPYFFSDANLDGVIDQAEGRSAVFDQWTPRLLRAAYNWKVVTADPGIHVHNPHYALELIYDSIEDLEMALGGSMKDSGLLR